MKTDHDFYFLSLKIFATSPEEFAFFWLINVIQKTFLDLIYKLKEGECSWRGRKKVQREKRKLVIPYSRPPLSP